MSHAALLPPSYEADFAPLTARYTAGFPVLSRLGRAGHFDNGLVISELLSLAAAAEQQIAEQKRRIAELEVLSRTDELTGLSNRRDFEDCLTRALAAASRHGEQGVIGILDLDGFKAINDRYGHDAGDRVLCEIGALLRDGVRSSDCAARLGGDEFAVILTRTKPAGGQRRLKILQQAIDARRFRFEGEETGLRASLGVAIFDGSSDLRTLLLDADRSMYGDKRMNGGR